MAPAEEVLLERLAMEPSATSAEERGEAERLLNTRAAARELFAFFRAFYEDVARSASSPAVERLLDELFPGEGGVALPSVVELQPFQPARRGAGWSSVLSASTPEKSRRYQTRAVFASELDHVVLRVVHDREDGCYHFHLLTPEVEHRAFAILSFEDIGLHVVTDMQGRVLVHEEEVGGGGVVPEQFPTPLVRLQVAASQPVDEDGSHRETLPTGHQLHLVRRSNAVSFTLRAGPESESLHIALIAVGDEQVVVPFDGVGETVDAFADEGPLVVRFYQ